ncbi:hypothetical protein [Dyella psychrodurans]|uniref:hypothetical protein n=1 Tax=Dyella psychrodurans TaxID=1927960 RepID=UPI0011C05135|nr:hypothetical protein [Dyella psychrodurans]
MIKAICLTSLLAASTSAVAQGYYEFIPYYGNNPFLFCTVGVPNDCWEPVSAQLGTYTITSNYCFNAYSANLFSRVCPRAFPQGLPGGSAMVKPPSMPSDRMIRHA